MILTQRGAEPALEWTRRVMGAIGLSLNEAKTCIRDARRARFDFLGYSFGPDRYRRTGGWYLSAKPSKKSIKRIKQSIRGRLRRGDPAPWYIIAAQVNRLLRGWAGYFSHGTRASAYWSVDRYVLERVRHFLRHRHKMHTRGTRRFTHHVIFGELGIKRLSESRRPSTPCALA